MAARDRVKAPGGLGIAGAALWRRLTADADLDFDSGSLLTLELACRQADDVGLLEKMLADQGAVVSGSKGQPRLSGVLAELRQQRYALNRRGSAIGLPEDDEPVGKSPTQRKAQRAADARWSRQRERGRPAVAVRRRSASQSNPVVPTALLGKYRERLARQPWKTAWHGRKIETLDAGHPLEVYQWEINMPASGPYRYRVEPNGTMTPIDTAPRFQSSTRRRP
jgi:hypothetical protein